MNNRSILSPRSDEYARVPREHDDDEYEYDIENQETKTSIEEETNTTRTETEEIEDDDQLKIRVLDLSGIAYPMKCNSETTVLTLKSMVNEAANVREALQRLIYRGQVLQDEKRLIEYKVEDGHTIHLFARRDPSNDVDGDETLNSTLAVDDNPWAGYAVNERVSPVLVFPTDGIPRIDPVMLDTPLGNCARRVKLWSSFLLIIYFMKVLSQFALMANMDNNNNTANEDSTEQYNRYRRYYSPYTHQDAAITVVELMIHLFGVYVGCLGFKAAHDTVMIHAKRYSRTIIALAILAVSEQLYVTRQIANSKYPDIPPVQPNGTSRYPSLHDVVSANVLQAGILAIMFALAVWHAICHCRELENYNSSLPPIINIVTPILPGEEDEPENPETPPPMEEEEVTVYPEDVQRIDNVI